ncbi:MAG: N-acetylneuraminate synthase family protein [Bacteroidetes bacterium]|nr:N-acetylneuraminate synthase family protein [Bacteroidota bacterium]
MNIKVIAEIASAHEGRMETLLKMVDVAVDAKCDYVKFQLFRAKELVAEDHPKYENYHIKEYSEQQWISVSDYCLNKKINVVAEVFDYSSFLITKKMNISGYKVHSTTISDIILLKEIAAQNRTIYLSSGGSTKEEVHKAIKIIKENGKSDIVILHGYQNFPTELKNINLSKIAALKKEFGLPIGIQDHVDGESLMATIVPLLAIAMGCTVIEKHFTLDRSLKESDYYSSLNPNELTALVNYVKETELVMGSDSFELSDDEMKYRNLLKKSIYTLTDIKAGELFSLKNLCFKRSLMDDRILVDQFDKIEGKPASIDIEANTRLTWNAIKM